MSNIIVNNGLKLMVEQVDSFMNGLIMEMLAGGVNSETALLYRRLVQLPQGYIPPRYFILTHPDHFLEIVAVSKQTGGIYEIDWRGTSYNNELLANYIWRRYIHDIWKQVVMMPEAVLMDIYTAEYTGPYLQVSFTQPRRLDVRAE